MKTTSTLNALLVTASLATLAVAAPNAQADTKNEAGSSSKYKNESRASAAYKDSHNSNRTMSDSKRDNKVAAKRNSDKTSGPSLSFWDRSKDTSASRSDSNRCDQTHRSVMKRNQNQRNESKNQPSVWDKLMFWR